MKSARKRVGTRGTPRAMMRPRYHHGHGQGKKKEKKVRADFSSRREKRQLFSLGWAVRTASVRRFQTTAHSTDGFVRVTHLSTGEMRGNGLHVVRSKADGVTGARPTPRGRACLRRREGMRLGRRCWRPTEGLARADEKRPFTSRRPGTRGFWRLTITSHILTSSGLHPSQNLIK